MLQFNFSFCAIRSGALMLREILGSKTPIIVLGYSCAYRLRLLIPIYE